MRDIEKATDSWFRPLRDGRVEIMCKAPSFRIRVSAPEAKAWEAVEMFETWTGLSVTCARRPAKRVRPLRGQLSMTELEFDGTD